MIPIPITGRPSAGLQGDHQVSLVAALAAAASGLGTPQSLRRVAGEPAPSPVFIGAIRVRWPHHDGMMGGPAAPLPGLPAVRAR